MNWIELQSHNSDTSSSVCLSERSSSTFDSAHTFDSDFPMGTIKRKPSAFMNPKIPLTSTTRLLVKELDDEIASGIDDSGTISRNPQRQSFRKSLTEEVNTIRRKTSAVSISARVQLRPESEQELDSLPLPPPPNFNNFNSSEDLHSIVDPESLPPPPPEAFENLLLDFPPPPPPLLLSCALPALSADASLKPCLKTPVSPPRVPPKPKKEEHVDVIYSGSRLSSAPSSIIESSAASLNGNFSSLNSLNSLSLKHISMLFSVVILSNFILISKIH